MAPQGVSCGENGFSDQKKKSRISKNIHHNNHRLSLKKNAGHGKPPIPWFSGSIHAPKSKILTLSLVALELEGNILLLKTPHTLQTQDLA